MYFQVGFSDGAVRRHPDPGGVQGVALNRQMTPSPAPWLRAGTRRLDGRGLTPCSWTAARPVPGGLGFLDFLTVCEEEESLARLGSLSCFPTNRGTPVSGGQGKTTAWCGTGTQEGSGLTAVPASCINMSVWGVPLECSPFSPLVCRARLWDYLGGI